jgi:hypothetical protein
MSGQFKNAGGTPALQNRSYQVHGVPCGNQTPNFRGICGLLFGGFSDGSARRIRSPAAKEKSQMPGAAPAAAKRPEEQEKQDGPLQNAAPVRAQNIFTSAKGASPSAYPK